MSQEQKIIKVYLEEVDKLDYMVFNFDIVKKVCMNDENCQNDLKNLFITLLDELVKEDFKLSFEDNKEYKKGLFKDVCREYIRELNRELSSVKSNIPESLKKIKI